MSSNSINSSSGCTTNAVWLYLLKGNSTQNCAQSSFEQKEQEDVLDISDASQQFQQVKQMVQAQPDVRIARTNRLAAAIDSGTYCVSSSAIADAVIRKHLIDVGA